MLKWWFILLFVGVVQATEFTATVNTNKIGYGDSLSLQLVLDDAKALTLPDLSELTRDFTVHSQQQYSSYSNYNGVSSSKVFWEVLIIPLKEGKIVIPSIEINTNKGRLRSAEINITVTPGVHPKSDGTAPATKPDGLGISLVATTNKVKTYVKEPLIYTLKIISYKNLANVILEDIKSNDAIIEKIGQPKQYSQAVGGFNAHIIEVKYSVTPVISGNIEITPAVISGETQEMAPNPVQRSNRFGFMPNMFFDTDFSLKPFRVQGEKLNIKAMPPAVKTANWLPLQNLTISEQWTGLNQVRVGDTITRRIKLVANGAFSNQLPSVKEFIEVDGLKYYADKPSLLDQPARDNEGMIGTKEESFSLVPLQEGKLTLPAVKIHWWNLRTNKAEVAILPAKTIEVLPGVVGNAKDAIRDYSVDQPKAIIAAPPLSKWLYALFAALVVIIAAMLGVIIYLLKRKRPAAAIPAEVSAAKSYSQKEITSSSDLRDQIITYASKNWRVPENVALAQLADFLSANNYRYDLAVYVELTTQMNAAIYAGAKTDLAALVELWEQFKRSVIKNKRGRSAARSAADLNPT